MPVIDLGSVVGPAGPQGVPGVTGAQGLQGNPGPNQVTDQTSTNLNGVLFGSQSRVVVKPVDSDPTADSTNLVSSGGTKAALDTKANQAQLAYVESGTTATKPNGYAIGEYFCWHGLLYKAKTAIGNGDAFTENTNCEKTTIGAELYHKVGITTSEQSNYTISAFHMYRIGPILMGYLQGQCVTPPGSADQYFKKIGGIGNIDDRPINVVTFNLVSDDAGSVCRLQIRTNGDVRLMGGVANAYYRGSFVAAVNE